MWRELIKMLCPACTFSAPANPERIADVESALHVALPAELKTLLAESNGVRAEYGEGLIWSAEEIKKNNLAFRSYPDFAELYMPFDALLFFADAGNGDQFAFIITAGVIRRPDVFLWNHESDSREWAASSLRRCLEMCLKK